jgi:hypothetical protein
MNDDLSSGSIEDLDQKCFAGYGKFIHAVVGLHIISAGYHTAFVSHSAHL